MLTRTRPLKRTPMKRRTVSTGPSPATREIVSVRSGGRCEFPAFIGCYARATQQHHRRPRRSGGSRDAATNGAANLVDLCAHHHAWVESNRRDALEMGLLLRAGDVPAAVPVQTRHDPLPVLLDDLGGWTQMDVAA